ncbi:MAG: hypothetical protein RL362_567 [Bacteroidota bacterium]
MDIHDLPHKSSSTEWWYLNAHFTTSQNRNFALFASFFKRAVSYDKKSGLVNYGYTLIWALSDLDNKKYYPVSLVDKDAPRYALQKIKNDKNSSDPFFTKAAIEVFKKGNVPYPDTLMKEMPRISDTSLSLDYDGQTFKKLKDKSYQLELKDTRQDISIKLNFKPNIKPVRSGEDGVIDANQDEVFFYYFIPNCEVSGSVGLKGEHLKIKEGSGWYDHEFAVRTTKEAPKDLHKSAWNWIGLQLSNGYQLMAYDVQYDDKQDEVDVYLILVGPDQKTIKTTNFKLEAVGALWTSTKTFNRYPGHWILNAPELDLKLELKASFNNQEFNTIISKPAFWEGRVDVTGTHKGKKITGKGFVERHGHVETNTIKDFLKSVSRSTLESVKKILPLDPDEVMMEELVSVKGNKEFLRDLDRKVYKDKLIAPIRAITDRGGKSWRSYATIACVDAVGGESQSYMDWMALPELMHVGSLIVDDVQDQSTIRRGGPSVHVMHGEAIAINSGNAAYFIGQTCIYHGEGTDQKKNRVYSCYFEGMRASHSGQALDINGLDYMFPMAIKDDALAKLLPNRVISIHRLKSGAPSGYLAKIGSILGDASKEQEEALTNFFYTLGISFQIIDDTLNLKGFKDNLKTKAEDITAGKITYPIALAMSKMPSKDRLKLWNIVKSKTDDIKLLTKAVELLHKYNAIEESEKIARNQLEKAWKKLDPIIEDSMVKINLRAFSLYVLARTY